MNKPSILLETPRLASWCDWTGIDPLPLIAGDRSCILWLRSGTGDACSIHCRIPIAEGACLFVPPNNEVTLRPPAGYPIRAVVYYVTGLQVQGLSQGLLSPREVPFVVPVEPNNVRINRILEDILHEARNPQLGSDEVISSLLQTLLIHFLREMESIEDHDPIPPLSKQQQEPEPIRASNSDNSGSLSQNVRVYIERNYHLELSLSDLAQLVYVSPYHLAHVFKDDVGMSPIQYLIKCRIDEAKRLLVDTDQSVRDIALQVGYPNANYFNLLFSKMTGNSPGKYRKRN
ncbi:helix-turn-helix domain-containing protein [Cohnella herbarum]|uniref:Helix-turn-helix domain-containing protein n=1 Tax=Cohnella herbarum TaxID=2728023 RepID=A0A7Z2ZLK7_9BACL|nr:AraC family transcriptional regulator [Cohnella herbarum]QJD83945.1 helix-turn-helix domain-containing protein [Cohnella herbarum]